MKQDKTVVRIVQNYPFFYTVIHS